MKVLLLTNYYLPGCKGGGPIKTICNLVENTKNDIDYLIVTSDRDLGDDKPYDGIMPNKWNFINGSNIYYSGPNILNIFKIIKNENYDVIYLNSFFSLKYSFLPFLFASILNKKIILSPRGELSKGALSIKAYKKNIFLKMYNFFKMKKNITFQATTEFEKLDIQRVLGNDTSIFVVENIAKKEFAHKIFHKDNEVLKIVSLSRITKIKNLKYSLELLSFVKYNIIFDIYGPIEDLHYWNECLKIINNMPRNIIVNYKGIVESKDVVNILSVYDIFLMPTQGENYGHVIVEALCSGLPILIADTTPWRNLTHKGIGWDLPLSSQQQFIDVIEHIHKMPKHKHYEMRCFILSWAKERFSKRDIIDKNIAIFGYAVKNK